MDSDNCTMRNAPLPPRKADIIGALGEVLREPARVDAATRAKRKLLKARRRPR